MTQPLNINPQKCTGCGGCIAVCPFAALSLKGDVAVVDPELCCHCGACVKSCPFSAISLDEEPQLSVADLQDYSGVWVFAEQHDGELHESAFELLAVGRRLADIRGCLLSAIVLGQGIAECAVALSAAGADQIILADEPSLRAYESSVYADALAQLIHRYNPEIVLAAATAVGRGFFAKTAVKAQTGLTADCTVLSIDPECGLLQQTRPAFGGNIMAEIITPNHRPQMATVRPHVFKRGQAEPGRIAKVLVETLKIASPATRIIKSIHDQSSVNLAEVDIIVAGGRGLKKSDNFKLLFQLANKLGGVVAASRACVDAGWISAAHQVGQTGKTVSPKVYLAFGISGAVQHLEGMRSSDKIIAVNSDPNAPIFDVADLSITGDLFEIIPGLIAAL
jgi:electron transfer flavoprotein alpha subunit/NAD-dependent dihydropyrimidine dehydrogenase PreA subunit